jgi:hypothetical protein
VKDQRAYPHCRHSFGRSDSISSLLAFHWSLREHILIAGIRLAVQTAYPHCWHSIGRSESISSLLAFVWPFRQHILIAGIPLVAQRAYPHCRHSFGRSDSISSLLAFHWSLREHILNAGIRLAVQTAYSQCWHSIGRSPCREGQCLERPNSHPRCGRVLPLHIITLSYVALYYYHILVALHRSLREHLLTWPRRTGPQAPAL